MSRCMQSRSSMKPGQMFVVRDASIPTDLRDVMVVVDDLKEVGFWTGGIWCWGHVAPSVEFEVLP